MEVVAKKSTRLLKVNIIVLAIMVVSMVLVGVLAENKSFLLFPSSIAIINILMIIDYFLTPKEMLVIDNGVLIVKKSFNRTDEYRMKDIANCLYAKYNPKSHDGVIALEVKGLKNVVRLQAIDNVEDAHSRIWEARKKLGLESLYNISNTKNTDTYTDVSIDNDENSTKEEPSVGDTNNGNVDDGDTF